MKHTFLYLLLTTCIYSSLLCTRDSITKRNTTVVSERKQDAALIREAAKKLIKISQNIHHQSTRENWNNGSVAASGLSSLLTAIELQTNKPSTKRN